MTPQDALAELLARLGAARGTPVFVNDEELSQWPPAAVAAMKSHKLLVKARPAVSVVCPGCERECVMPVQTVTYSTRTASFIVCDKRSDINRVRVSALRLTQWQSTGVLIADALAVLLECSRTASTAANGGQWPVGILKGKTNKSAVTLRAESELQLLLAGHTVPLIEVLAIEKDALALDKTELMRLVGNPAANAVAETPEQRCDRLRALVGAEKAKGTRAFLQRVARDEGISVSRLKQIVDTKKSSGNAWGDLSAGKRKTTVSIRKKTPH